MLQTTRKSSSSIDKHKTAAAFLCIGCQFRFLYWQKIIYSGCSVKHPERSCLRASFSAKETDFVRLSVAYQVNFQSGVYGLCGNFEARSHGADIRWSRSQNKWPILSRCHANTAFAASNVLYLRQHVRISTRFRPGAPGLWNSRVSDSQHTQFHQITSDVVT